MLEFLLGRGLHMDYRKDSFEKMLVIQMSPKSLYVKIQTHAHAHTLTHIHKHT